MSQPLPTYVFVTGSRHFAERKPDRARHYDALRTVMGSYKPDQTVLVHGDCRGLDRMAGTFAHRWAGVMPVPARWGEGNKAGPIRNQLLVTLAVTLRDAGYTCEWHAFPTKDSRGTYDCIRKAEAAKFSVNVHQLDP